MFKQLKQFVPSEYCFQCKNCCVFESSTTPWRPLIVQEEKLRSCLTSSFDCFDQETVHPDGYLKTTVEKDHGRCGVLTENYLCRCYESRPFECRLYPFVVVEKEGKPNLAAHLCCPYVQEHFHDETYSEYVDYLIKNFQTSEYRLFLNRNRDIARTYSDSVDELDFVYELEEISDIAISSQLKLVESSLRDDLKKMKVPLSAYAFPGIAVWEAFFGIDVRAIDDIPCIFASNNTGTFLYTLPLSKEFPLELIDKVFQIMEKVNISPSISRVENVPEAFIPFFDEEKYRIVYKTNEFVYRREDIANFRGNAYKSKRSDYNYFIKHHDARLVPYQQEMGAECLRLFEKWTRQKGDGSDLEARHMIDDARQVHRVIFQNYASLEMTGRVVIVNDMITAYTFGYPVSDMDFCIFAEITDRDFKGLPSFIFREFCCDSALLPFERINVMDAFGLPKLEATKYSFRPIETIPVYTVYKK